MTRKRRDLTDDEQILWNHIAKKVKPLKSEKKRITPKPQNPKTPKPRDQ